MPSLKNILIGLLLLYVLALHTSMAAMEILGWTITALALIDHGRRRDFSLVRRNRALILWLAILVGSILVPLLIEPQSKGILFQFGYVRWTLLLFGLALALEIVWSEIFERRFVLTWAGMLILTGAYGLLQSATAIDFLREGKIYPQGNGVYKAVGFFSFSMTFAYSVGISTVGIALPALKRGGQWLAMAAWIFGMLGILSSMSRGAWLAAAFCAFFYLACNRPRWILPAVVVLGVLIGNLAYWNDSFAGKFNGLWTLHIGSSESIRANLWRGYWAMYLDHPIFGVGLLEGDRLLPAYFAKLGIQQDFVSHAHNNFLQFLVGAGIGGLVAYGAVVFILMRKAWRLRRVDPAWGWSLFLAQLFLQLGGLTEANFVNTSVNHFLVLIFALTLALEARASRGKQI